MSEVTELIATIKRQLKAQGKTYRDVADALCLSEPSVKRLFSRERLTLERLAQLAALLGFTLSELMQTSSGRAADIHSLSSADELRLVTDQSFLLVTVCLLNHWSVEDIVNVYSLSREECDTYLLELQAMRVISVLPGNRIRLRIARDFVWIPDGPIQRFFRREGLGDFLDAPFERPAASLDFVHGMLTDAALAQLQTELRRLRSRFATLHEESADAPLAQKRGTGLLMATREWEPTGFQQRRRRDVTEKPRSTRSFVRA